MVVEKDPRAALLSGVQQLLLRHNIHAHVDSPCLSGLPPKQSKTKKSAEARFELTITAMTADVNNALATSDLATDALVQGVCKTMADVVRRPIFYHTGNGKGESGVVNPDEKRSDAHLHVSVKYSEAGSAELHRGGGGTVKRRKRYFFSVENKTTSRHSWSTSLSPWSSPLSTSTTKSSVLMSLSTSSDSSLQTPTTPIAVHSPLLGLVFDKA
ncbi:hypothetical protein CC85DRAFT_321465 [Cutaneotrichosporon oleaginosum]|uniref:Uncharacterized protein n=1 Tax=Cutaneotrichosporon oleaginosum TaxID=879819 RepID=A0A0J0XI01_9TREE|nr:uncharacterized protein CC85DRAFT_321465 [Cutaneotrichosporon oleaginosum]KLT40703.1 hypothetical protein CC85DRAFT_321465 [Cutaneotrichosporon oleaginosum]TXT14247.1 hypothetical protein COLE_00440 [Cutaneotrichosporon oleaginosum]